MPADYNMADFGHAIQKMKELTVSTSRSGNAEMLRLATKVVENIDSVGYCLRRRELAASLEC
jgi:hypothetical protein